VIAAVLQGLGEAVASLALGAALALLVWRPRGPRE
jgi:hypothetical protein